MRHPHLIGATKTLQRCLRSSIHDQHRTAVIRSFSTSRVVFNDKHDAVEGIALEDTLTAPIPTESVSSLSMENIGNADLTEISQIALETGSNTGLAFVSNNVMGAFSWLKSFFSGGEATYAWNDVVTHKLTHLYIPSVYEFVQHHTGLSWFVVIGVGSLTLRCLLLPLTRRSMRMPTLLRTTLPQMKMYEDMVDSYTKQRDQERMKKVTKWKNDYMKSTKSGSVLPSMVATTFVMVAINRGMRHLAHITPLIDGGIGPFVDMSVNSHSGVGFYCLPLCITTALASIIHLNLRNEKWYNPRICVVVIPVGGMFTYFISSLPLTMTLHYAISSWCTFFLNYSSQNEYLRNLRILQLPKMYRRPPVPEVISLSKKQGISSDIKMLENTLPKKETDSYREFEHYTTPAQQSMLRIDHDGTSGEREHSTNQDPLQLERKLFDEFIDVRESIGERKQLEFNNPYTPFFKLGELDAGKELRPGKVTRVDNIQPPPPKGGVMSQVQGMAPKFQFWKRFKNWWYRQQLIRHGKKGKMKLFLDEAPQETMFIQEAVELTTKVTPGLKRYVLRRQYPMETLEELEKKVSYIERVQGHRW